MDEKDFLIDIYNVIKRIVAVRQFKNKKLFDASQDKSREFIFFLVNIYADSTALPPILIYKNKSGDLQNT